ncbi:glycoside hydrolase family 32 protein [Cellvibrio sp. pealriver]|uniref:glycoside hydrolase family 32 protein n=1 Tax=Cellvibrio sp. pealriver TaxID=1622269 RepID=UPI00066FBE0A|nr:glycoside hydrolase family 32 protein [Cellvibrio sp. pealriver]
MKRYLSVLGVTLGLSFGLTCSLTQTFASGGASSATGLYQEQYRPQFHFSPVQQWMNDPNGMVYYAGEYHFFYQHNPYSTIWGPMHWGHAVSKDLVHWEHLPIALFPDHHGAIFSGSAVMDLNNTSGFGSKKNPPMVAIFTYHDHWAEKLGAKTFQSQGLAYSLDKGRSWTKYAGNPVLKSPDIPDFRDPKVTWHEASKQWLMTLAVKDRISFYASKDLKKWQHLSDFGQQIGAHGGVWECPDLIKMRVEGSAEEKYVLLVSINPGAPNGGSGTQYFVGDFDGKTFTLDKKFARDLTSHPAADVMDKGVWLDHGTDNYAGVTWANLPATDSRTLFAGWMNNWNYANQIPTDRWRGAMTLPRELVLVKRGDDYRVHSRLVAEIEKLHQTPLKLTKPITAKSINVGEALAMKNMRQRFQLSIHLQQATTASLVIGNSDERVVFSIDNQRKQLQLQRADSGQVAFESGFAKPQIAALSGALTRVDLDVVLDRSSIEIFVNGGERVFTSQIFPTAPYDSVSLNADAEVTLQSASAFVLGSIWN